MSNFKAVQLLAFLLLLAFPTTTTTSQVNEAMEVISTRLDSKKATSSIQKAAAMGVLKRLLPTHVSSFDFKIVPKDVCGGYSCFWISNVDSGNKQGKEIMIKGTTAVEIASGLHWYLKYWCGAHISWDKTGGVQLSSIPSPGSLPVVKDEGVMIQRPVPWNYYQNVVTSSYVDPFGIHRDLQLLSYNLHPRPSKIQYVWWDWERWEKEIDWMALQGINLPLAFTGQEAVWQKVFKSFYTSKEDLDGFFGGPAFLAWARMGNLHGWGGPLEQSWLNQQLALQKLILSRMIELGMTPVLPSFSGNVPVALKKKFPSANITRLGEWNTVDGNPRWCCTYLLDPSDPLFVEIGDAFIKQQLKEYGDVTDIYNCDTFNENAPPTSDPAYISLLGAAVYKAMSYSNKNAVWLMQALLHSVPFGKMIVLDLFADVKPIWEESSQFYGTPYVWCLLHNFGGNIEMYGILDVISSGPVDARISQNSTMDWLKSYSYRRYGKEINLIDAAWEILHRTIYNCTDGIADHNKDFIVKLPDWDPSLYFHSIMSKGSRIGNLFEQDNTKRFFLRETTSDLPQPHLWYSNEEAIIALQLFLDAGNYLAGSLTYRYDLVDLTRQVLSKLANHVYMDAMLAFQVKDAKSLSLHSQKFVQLIKDIDILLATDNNFLLGTWIESAKRLAVSPSEKRQYEWNARTQVTMWYDNTETEQSKLHDYANKFWSGLLARYYLPRASTYFHYLLTSVQRNESFKLDEWRREWISFSNKWQSGTELYPVQARGDSLAISKALFKKYLS
ncbi:hypothetical protein IFM89_039832 [Coptis chinensis]|uniref:Alpha-N-acetylglucosaminidase n=1 Tax=Coptis chinensis TaxID=261450 RepID=A0A835LAA8_9MAGN|nr:hypothetical protein IFM89_039832 [Coptis chinensis]